MAAAARAAHLIVDDDPPIFADTLAETMLGERAEELIGFHRAHGTHPILAGARAQVTCRSRYTEDSLADAISHGIGQYVVLGAGLDSFASRSSLAGQVRVFEVDHPATQEWKRRILPAPGNVTFVPVDFTGDSLGDRLGQAGFDFAGPAFVSWLGVTIYLEEGAIEQTVSIAGGSPQAARSSSTTCCPPGGAMPRATATRSRSDRPAPNEANPGCRCSPPRTWPASSAGTASGRSGMSASVT